MKKLSFAILCVLGLFLTGCGNEQTKLENDNEIKNESKGKCTVTECIKQINIEDTVEEINNIIGFEGELIDEKDNKYYWKLSEDTGVEVTYNSRKKAHISAKYNRSLFKNSKVDFSRYESDIKKKIDDGITYESFVNYLGNAEGNLILKNSLSNEYIWVNEDGDYLIASFSVNSNECISVRGYF